MNKQPKSIHYKDVKKGYEVLDLTLTEIGKQLGLTYQRVQQIVKQFGFKRKPKKIRQIK